MARIRVVIADDSLTVRKRLVHMLEADHDFQVVGEARNGREAFEMCRRIHPDVVTMDMMMPQMNGVTATEHIMAYCPTPILVVSASVNRGEVLKTFDAIAAGAVEVIEKPGGSEQEQEWVYKFRSALRLVSHIKPITHPRARLRLGEPALVPPGDETKLTRASTKVVPTLRRVDAEIVAIGASTGGPAAMVEILSRVSEDFPLPILLVIHIAPEFANGFVEWLDEASRLRVRYAADGEPLPGTCAGTVLMAPPDRHLEVLNRHLSLTRVPERHSCRPSVDVLFESIAREYGPRAIACLLTGMGTDGAQGLLKIRLSGGFTIAQDRSSCVVFGMPREAIRIGAAEVILPLAEVVPALCRLVPRGSRRWESA